MWPASFHPHHLSFLIYEVRLIISAPLASHNGKFKENNLHEQVLTNEKQDANISLIKVIISSNWGWESAGPRVGRAKDLAVMLMPWVELLLCVQRQGSSLMEWAGGSGL